MTPKVYSNRNRKVYSNRNRIFIFKLPTCSYNVLVKTNNWNFPRCLPIAILNRKNNNSIMALRECSVKCGMKLLIHSQTSNFILHVITYQCRYLNQFVWITPTHPPPHPQPLQLPQPLPYTPTRYWWIRRWLFSIDAMETLSTLRAFL